MQLNSRQRAQLRSLANPLRPVVQVGKEGVTASSIRSLEEALNTRELVKIKVQESAPVDARAAGELLVQGVPDATVVATIGRTVILYRRDPERPVIELDAGG